MRILLASSEVFPFSKTGGLADMVAGLAKALVRRGHEVALVAPLYAGIRERFPQTKLVEPPLDLSFGPRKIQASVWRLDVERNHTIYFVAHREYFERPGLYQENGVDY